MVHSDALMQDKCYEFHSGRCIVHVDTARTDDTVTDDENKENEPPPEPPEADNNAYGSDGTDSAPETELEILCIKANTVQMDIPNSLSNSDVVHSGEPETACDDNDTDSAPETELELCHIKAIQGANSPPKSDVVCHVEHSVETVCDDNSTNSAIFVMVKCEPSVEPNQEIYDGETDIETEACDGNANVALSQGRSNDIVEPNTNSQDVSAENTNTQDVSDENSDENLDVSDNFKEYRDQLMIMSQELSELVQNSLDKLSLKQQINSKVCDLIESCGLEFRDLGRHLITVSKDIKKAYKANVEKKPCIKRKSDGIYTCSVCSKEFTLRPSCYNHLKIHTTTKYFCTKKECNYSCKSESTFKEHSKYYHLRTKTVKCKSKHVNFYFRCQPICTNT